MNLSRSRLDDSACPECFEPYDSLARKPIKIQCGHQLCEDCFGESLKFSNSIFCPVCGQIDLTRQKELEVSNIRGQKSLANTAAKLSKFRSHLMEDRNGTYVSSTKSTEVSMLRTVCINHNHKEGLFFNPEIDVFLCDDCFSLQGTAKYKNLRMYSTADIKFPHQEIENTLSSLDFVEADVKKILTFIKEVRDKLPAIELSKLSDSDRNLLKNDEVYRRLKKIRSNIMEDMSTLRDILEMFPENSTKDLLMVPLHLKYLIIKERKNRLPPGLTVYDVNNKYKLVQMTVVETDQNIQLKKQRTLGSELVEPEGNKVLFFGVIKKFSQNRVTTRGCIVAYSLETQSYSIKSVESHYLPHGSSQYLPDSEEMIFSGGLDSETLMPTSKVVRYHPVKNEVINLAPMREARSDHRLAIVGNNLFAIGGYRPKDGALKTCEKLQLESTNQSSWLPIASMNKKRKMFASVVVKNDTIIVFGGENDKKFHDSIEVYDISADTWTLIEAKLPGFITELEAVVIDNETVVLTGGKEQSAGQINMATRFDVTNQSFDTDLPALKYPRSSHLVVFDGKYIYCFGGNQNEGKDHYEMLRYPPKGIDCQWECREYDFDTKPLNFLKTFTGTYAQKKEDPGFLGFLGNFLCCGKRN